MGRGGGGGVIPTFLRDYPLLYGTIHLSMGLPTFPWDYPPFYRVVGQVTLHTQ
nr:MAG TPA: hypothetical protein [Caudoviricetes sp.]